MMDKFIYKLGLLTLLVSAFFSWGWLWLEHGISYCLITLAIELMLILIDAYTYECRLEETIKGE